MKILHIGPAGEPLGHCSVPALEFLSHDIEFTGSETSSLVSAQQPDVVLLDATSTLSHVQGMAERLMVVGLSAPLIVVLTEGGLAAARPEWGARDLLLATAGPAEVEARLRLAGSETARVVPEDEPIRVGDLAIDAVGYTATVGSLVLDLTYKEFELLKFLAQNPGRVFTRAQLLQDVWGYDYYGGTRTVDVHIRRLRAKLGSDLEHSIGTVRNVGYRFSPEIVVDEDLTLDEHA